MMRYGMVWVLLSVVLACAPACRAESPAPDERGLWQVWIASTNAPDDHAAVVAACKAFRTKAAPDDPLKIVVAELEAWHLLKLGNTKEAAALLEPALANPGQGTPLQTVGAELARGWLTRLDREKVKAALKKLYVRDIEFPKTLEVVKSLKDFPLPPLADRWGKPWVYRRESSIRGMASQQYVLESSGQGARSDLAKALSLPYAGCISLEPLKVSPVSDDTVEFKTTAGKRGFLQAGGDLDGVTVAYVGANLIVMADDIHWRVALKPR